MHTLPASGSGSADAAADLAGNDPFAALLAQVAPSDATTKTPGRSGQKGTNKDTPVSSDADDTQTAAKSEGTNDPASAGGAASLSAQNIAAQRTDPSQADSAQTDPSQGDPSQADTSKTKTDLSQTDPSQADPSKIAAANAGKSAQTKIIDPDAAASGKAKGATATGADTPTDPKTGADTDTKTATKRDTKTDKKGSTKSDTKTGSNLAANPALIPMPIVAANFLPITLTLATPDTRNGADDPAADIVSAAGAGAKGAAPTDTAQGQGSAKTAKDPQSLADLDNVPDGADPDDALPQTGKATDSAADKKSAKQDPKQAGPQTPTKLNADPGAALSKPAGRNSADGAQIRAPQANNGAANAPAPQAAIPQAAVPAPAPATGPAPVPGMPTTLQTPAASAPQSTQSTPATLQAAPQTPTSVTPNLNLFALNIAARAQGGLKQFDITMDPADLGRVNVSLSIDSAGKTQAHLSADRPQTLALLQQDSSSLRIALRNVGLNVAQNGLNFSLNGQNPGQHNAKSTPGGRGRALSIRAVAAVGAAQSVLPVFSSTGVNTRLDIHV